VQLDQCLNLTRSIAHASEAIGFVQFDQLSGRIFGRHVNDAGDLACLPCSSEIFSHLTANSWEEHA
jgi:hypothetical protein